MFVKDSKRDRDALILSLSGLTARKEGLQTEIAQLSTQASNASVALNTTKFSVSEAESKLRKLKNDLVVVQRDIDTVSDELARKVVELSEAKKEYENVTAITREKTAALEGLIDAKEKELLGIHDAIDARLRKLNIEIKDKESELVVREEKNKESERKNQEDSASLDNLRNALEDERKNLKLYELKLRDLAKKKDIDLQITSLMG
jgi:chromosome segregation ATPase